MLLQINLDKIFHVSCTHLAEILEKHGGILQVILDKILQVSCIYLATILDEHRGTTQDLVK